MRYLGTPKIWSRENPTDLYRTFEATTVGVALRIREITCARKITTEYILTLTLDIDSPVYPPPRAHAYFDLKISNVPQSSSRRSLGTEEFTCLLSCKKIPSRRPLRLKHNYNKNLT